MQFERSKLLEALFLAWLFLLFLVQTLFFILRLRPKRRPFVSFDHSRLSFEFWTYWFDSQLRIKSADQFLDVLARSMNYLLGLRGPFEEAGSPYSGATLSGSRLKVDVLLMRTQPWFLFGACLYIFWGGSATT